MKNTMKRLSALFMALLMTMTFLAVPVSAEGAAWNPVNAVSMTTLPSLRLTTISSAKASKDKTLTVKWKKDKDATGYQVQYSTSSKFSNASTVKVGKNKTSTTIKKLKAGQKYYVRVRATKKGGKYAKWSKTKSATVPGKSSSGSSSSGSSSSSDTVYITDTGEKYHRGSCRYLKKSKYSISRSKAKSRGYAPCSVCKP